MEGTCKKEKCPYFEEHGEKCPFFVETVWNEEKSGQAKVVQDCAPIRSMLMQQDFHNRMIGIQQSVESQRNKVEALESSFNTVLQQTRDYINIKTREEFSNEKENVKKKSFMNRVVQYLEGEK